MKSTLVLLLLSICLNSFSQNKFTLSGYGAAFQNGDKIFLSYRTPNGFIEDSVNVKNKKFQFSGTISFPVKANLYRNQNPKYADIIYDAATVYLEKGHIKLSSVDTLRHSVNGGTPLNKDYAVLKAALQSSFEKMLTLRNPSELNENEKGNTALVKRLEREYRNHLDSMVPIQFTFISEHPDSYVSLVTLKDLVRDSRWLINVERSFNRLSPELKLTDLGKNIDRDIQLGKRISVGMQAVDFDQPDINGKIVRLKDFKGKYILLDFWASWCLPCRSENPNLLTAFEKYKNRGFVILSLSIDKKKDEWLAAVQEDRLLWPQLSDLKGNDNLPYKLYGITTIPANFLISPDGLIIGKDLKGEALQGMLNTLFPD